MYHLWVLILDIPLCELRHWVLLLLITLEFKEDYQPRLSLEDIWGFQPALLIWKPLDIVREASVRVFSCLQNPNYPALFFLINTTICCPSTLLLEILYHINHHCSFLWTNLTYPSSSDPILLWEAVTVLRYVCHNAVAPPVSKLYITLVNVGIL